ncbi:dihydrofolate reductase family protein [Thermoactinospora rubra]|uniref:dihydrofolate reductase family protein n=1 Tax=Thermoactinospora rubra TaxID=1088767 RepID=UPI0011807C93|nr:dihydrofolate reductase family protein [Thermoactinospora rubra]
MRTVIGNITLSLDGRVNGTGGDYDMGWIVPHAVSRAGRTGLERMTATVTTALLGRKNYEGFGGYWPAVARDETADPRDRAYAQWLDKVEKVVFSTTLREAPWENSRIADGGPAEVVRRLREQGGGDIIVLSSGSVITQLLEAGELDELWVTLCPEVVGGGRRLLEDGLPASSWRLAADPVASETGALALRYERVRQDG